MILSKRERTVALVTAAAVGIFLFDQYVLTPVTAAMAYQSQEKDRLLREQESARQTFERQRKDAATWKAMTAQGLKSNASEAEQQIYHKLRDWASEAKLTLTTVKPDVKTQKGDLGVSAFTASGTGPMSAVSRFLWLIESASIPVQVTDLTIGSRKAGTDDLSVQLHLTTLYLAPKSETEGKSAGDKKK